MIPTENNNGQVFEMVLFTVKESELHSFLESNRKVHNHLRSFDGFVKSNTFQSQHNANTFLDIVLWENREKAEAAVHQFEIDPTCITYFSAIDSVIFNEHLVSFKDSLLSYDESGSKDILEAVLFYIKSDTEENFLKERKNTMKYIHSKYEGFRSIQTLKSYKTDNLFIDLPIWSDLDLCAKAQKELMNDPQFGAMMQYLNMDKSPIMELLRKVR